MSLLSDVYGRAAGFRRAWYGRRPDRARCLEQPVISVGNLSLGGSGKTPVVAALARLLSAAGESPSILTRGYGRRRTSDGVVVVSDGREVLVSAQESGDEPQMLARALPRVPVLVSSDRYLAGRLAERRFGCNVHLLDDGFQHVQLARDIDLLVISVVDRDESLLPWGRLRESFETAAVADALLVPGSPDVVASIGERLGVVPAFRLALRYGSLRFLSPSDGSAEPGLRVVAVAGIARPERFFTALRDGAAGRNGNKEWDVAKEIVFRDHHWFSRRDLDSIERVAVDAGADLVLTTEKDAMRLEGVRTANVGIPWAYLPLQVEVEPAVAFAEWLHERLRTARSGRQPGSRQSQVSSALATGDSLRPGDDGEAV